ncbi:MAG: hypothetical protein U0Q55_00510 [Vicinamibacterales bacterium]
MEQAPGPLGSPQAPQPPGAQAGPSKRADELLPMVGAKVENCFSSSVLAQVGQAGDRSARVRYSKCRPHERHAYS